MNMNDDIYRFLLLFRGKNAKQLLVEAFFYVRLCCVSSSLMTVNEESGGFELLAGQKRQLGDVTLGSRQQRGTLFTIF